MLTYEATNTFDISFIFDVSYYDINGIEDPSIIDNISIINTLDPTNISIDIFQVYFQTFETNNFEYISYILNLKIIDTRPPILNFNNFFTEYIESSSISILFENIENIELPLIDKSGTIINKLQENINFLNNNNNNNINSIKNYFIDISSNYIFYKIPGINIDDKVHGNTNTLENQTLSDDFSNKYDINIKYSFQNLSSDIIEISNSDISFLLFNDFSYIQNYEIIDNLANNKSDISRIIIVKYFDPFINLKYDKNSADNIFKKKYHEQYRNYVDLFGKAFDYYDGSLNFNNDNIVNYNRLNNIIRNELGIHNIEYIVQNQQLKIGRNIRKLHIVSIKCLPNEFNSDNNFLNFINNQLNFSFNNRIGLYGSSDVNSNIGIYKFNIEDLSCGIRIFSKDSEDNIIYDISQIITLESSNRFIYQTNTYYSGNITLHVLDNSFNRASIEYIDLSDNSNNKIYEDIFLFSDKCEPLILNNPLVISQIYEASFNIDICLNTNPNPKRFLLDGELKNSLHLSFGKYQFYYKNHRSFYYPINFSLLKDGHHYNNNDISFNSFYDISYQELYNYDKNITTNKLPGFSNSYLELIIDGTTPPLLYLYCRNFKGMSIEINVKNNIVFSKDTLILNSNILTKDNSNVFLENSNNLLNELHTSFNNKIFLSLKIEDSSSNKKSIIGLTHQNLNHNTCISNNKIIIRKYSNMSDNSNIKHDISENYLFETNINNKYSNILLLKTNYIPNTDISYALRNDSKEFDIPEIFLKNNMISNYYNFFKNNILLDISFNFNNFIYKINELTYINQVKLKDGGKIYEYFNNNYLLSDKPEFDNITDNKFTFNLQVYINKELLGIENNKLNYLTQNFFNKNIDLLYPIDYDNIFFNNFFITILSDIGINDSEEIIPNNKSIIFSNGNIELYDYLLDSNTTSNYLYTLHGAKFQDMSADIEYNFRRFYNTTNWESSGNLIEENDDYIFIPSNNIIYDNSQISLFSFSIENNINILARSTDISFSDLSVIKNFNSRINTLHYTKNKKWYLLTDEKNGIYESSNNGLTWTNLILDEYLQITYYKSITEINEGSNNIFFFTGCGNNSVLYLKNLLIYYIDIFDVKTCNKVKYFNDISKVFFCGNNNSRDKFCLAYRDTSNNNFNNFNIDLIESDLSYSKLSSNYKIYLTNICEDIDIDISNTIVMVGHIKYYDENTFLTSQSSIFYSTNNGISFEPVNSINLFKYGFRIIYFNNKFYAFGSDSIDDNISIGIDKINNSNRYNVNKLATSDNGIIWTINTQANNNILNYITYIENVENKNNELFIYGNDRYNNNFIIKSSNGDDWDPLINSPQLYNQIINSNYDYSYNYCNNYVNINDIDNDGARNSYTNNNFVILDPFTINNDSFSIDLDIKFNTSVLGLGADELIFYSKDICNNKIIIKRLYDYSNNLYIETSNDFSGHGIVIDYSFNNYDYYNIKFVQDNTIYDNSCKIIYIDNSKIELHNIIDISFNTENGNLDYNINFNNKSRNSNYIGDYINKEKSQNTGITLKYIKFYNKILRDSTIYKNYNYIQDVSNIDSELKNKIILTFKENDSVSASSGNNFIGLTEENLYHNFYIEENNKFIFHKYNSETNNIQVITDNISLEKTNSEKISNKKYLLEISNNDIYNCFTNANNNIYTNFSNKNSYLTHSNLVDYKLHLSYFIDNEFSTDNSIVNFFDVSLTETYNINFNSKILDNSDNQHLENENNLHSNFYLIDLVNFVDRNFYNSSILNNKISYENINYNNLNFIIKDISYIKNFNLYDIDSSRNIIYDKNNIYKLNYLQIFIHNINIKMDVCIKACNNNLGSQINNYVFINNLNIQNYQELFENIDVISNTYSLNLPNTTLNDLFALNLYNIKLLIDKYNSFLPIFSLNFFYQYVYITNTYDSIINFNNIDKMLQDASSIEINIDNLLYNIQNYFDSNFYQDIPVITEFEDFEILKNLVKEYYEKYKELKIIIYEIYLRSDSVLENNDISLNIKLQNIKDNIFDYDSINNFYINLINNLILFDELLILFLNESNYITIEERNDISFNFNPDNNPIDIYNYDISLGNLYKRFSSIEHNYDIIRNAIDNKFYYIDDKIFDKINYVLQKSQFAINSGSNNITIKFDVYYNSYLFNNVYLNTLVTDLAIPDIIRPTIIFNNIFDKSNNPLNVPDDDDDIERVLNDLISDISYIDTNTTFPDFSDNNINYNYSDDLSYNNDIFYLDLDISELYNQINETVEIIYKIRDIAGNENIIPRRVVTNFKSTAIKFKYTDSSGNTFTITRFNRNRYSPLVIDNLTPLTLVKLKKDITVKDSQNPNHGPSDYLVELSNSLLTLDASNNPIRT